MFFRKATISLLALSLMLVFGQSLALASEVSYVLANDTVAGESSYLKATGFSPNSNVIFSVEKPDGTIVAITTETGAGGEVNYELSGYHTRVSGEYSIVASSSDSTIRTKSSNFYVYSGELSENHSEMRTNRAVIKADDVDYAVIEVVAKDEYDNLLKGRGIKLLSYRNADLVSPSISLTNSYGKAQFQVKSFLPGIAGMIAMDVTEDIIIEDRVNISFVDESVYVADIGGDYIGVANAAEFGVLDHFEIEDVPSVVKKNENISFTVKAVDSDILTVEDYTGTVRFSAEGDNSSAVTLPENYKFMVTDLGQHQFSLGLTFAEEGTYTIAVNDLTDKFKSGEKTVVVGESVSSGSSDEGEQPQISSPAPGTYSQAEQTVSGTAKGGSNVKIFDNNQEVGAVIAGTTGKFSYQMSALEDGDHSIYVVSVNNISNEIVGTSDTIDITVDTDAPAIEDIQIEPSTGIEAGSVINVKVYSEENLTQAALIFNYDIVELNASIDDPSVYVGTIQAPAELGVYTVSVLLVDELQNEITYEDQVTVTVDSEGGNIDVVGEEEVTPPEDVVEEEILPQEGMPSEVSGLIAYGSDKRVTLVWDAATDNGLVKNYKVYYGSDVTDLAQVMLTKDASTTWYIPNLGNGEEYFFAVSAIDDEGNESAVRSEIVSGIPFVLEINNALSQAPTEPLAQPKLREAAYSGPFPDETPANGPGVVLLFAGSVLAGYVIKRKRK